MALTEAQLRELSALIDALQALPDTERAGWLAALGPEQAAYRPTLQRLAGGAAGAPDHDFLDTLPKLDATAAPEIGGFEAGNEVGPYRLQRELGRGGMGTVWRAERSDGALKRAVALKLPHSALPHRQLAERFARERDILAALAHPNIARLYDAGVTAGGQPYLALEYVEGEALLAWCDARRLGLRARVELYLQALAAVQYAHGQLVIHRDLKPSNMLVTAQGELRLLDFGIAKLLTDGQAEETALTQASGRALTPQYASPEQILGQPLGTASDVYALGVVFYELLTGVLPYRVQRDSRAALEEAIVTAEPVRPSRATGDPQLAAARALTAGRLARDIGGDLETITLKALKKQPAERYASVDAFAADLRRWLAGEPVAARPDSPWYRARKFVLRHRWNVGIAVGVLLAFALAFGLGAMVVATIALAAGLAVAMWQAAEARRQARLAQAAAAKAQLEARTARAVQDFLRQIFEANTSNQPDPQKARQTTARELLDIGVARLDSALQDVPEAKAAVLRIVSDMYFELGLNERAAQLAEQCVDLMRILRGPHHPDVAHQLVEVSQMIQMTHRRAERGPLLREALRIVSRDPQGDRGLHVRVLRQLALLESDLHNARAMEYAREAVALCEAGGAADELVAALMVLGLVQERCRDIAGSEATLLRALELSATAPDFHRRQRIMLLAYLGDAQESLGKVAAAEASFRQGLDLAFAVSGPDHVDAAQMEMRLGDLLFASARTREGLRLLESARARVIRVKGADNRTILPKLMLGEGCCRVAFGDLAAADALRADAARLCSGEGANRGTGTHLLRLARIALALGRVPEARSALAQFDAGAHEGEIADRWSAELRDLVEVSILLAEEVPERACAVGAKAGAAADAERQSLAQWDQLLLWGEIALELGDARAALAVTDRALQAIAADPAPQFLALREQAAAALAGAAHCALGAAASALPHLARAVALAEAHYDPEHSPQLAAALVAVATACAELGQTAAGQAALGRAQAILARHPHLAAGYARRCAEAGRRLAAAASA